MAKEDCSEMKTSCAPQGGECSPKRALKPSGYGIFGVGVAGCAFFTSLIWFFGERLDSIQLLPDQGFLWYYWKLPEPTFWSRLSAWSLYALHQIAVWGLIYWGKQAKQQQTHSATTVGAMSLGVNAVFVVLHLFQTHIWYDGLAQDVPIWSSLASVAILLIWVLILENPRRGIFFGQKANFSDEMMHFAKAYHGYYFAWAVIYTFWYHPMVASAGHLFGFCYTMLLLLQGSLFGTSMHTNKYWVAFLEVLVLFHGVGSTYTQANTSNRSWHFAEPKNLLCMFGLGFAAMFVVTQMYGLGLTKQTQRAFHGVYLALVLYVYSHRGWAKMNEIVRIPVANYLGLYLLAAVLSFCASCITPRVRAAKHAESRRRTPVDALLASGSDHPLSPKTD